MTGRATVALLAALLAWSLCGADQMIPPRPPGSEEPVISASRFEQVGEGELAPFPFPELGQMGTDRGEDIEQPALDGVRDGDGDDRLRQARQREE